MKVDIDDFSRENYHRFDNHVPEIEFPMTAMTIFPINHREAIIPPQPLRPAPIILPQSVYYN